MNRGRARITGGAVSAMTGFNEAPIHESGKVSARVLRGTCFAVGFNEAPIHESGKGQAVIT